MLLDVPIYIIPDGSSPKFELSSSGIAAIPAEDVEILSPASSSGSNDSFVFVDSEQHESLSINKSNQLDGSLASSIASYSLSSGNASSAIGSAEALSDATAVSGFLDDFRADITERDRQIESLKAKIDDLTASIYLVTEENEAIASRSRYLEDSLHQAISANKQSTESFMMQISLLQAEKSRLESSLQEEIQRKDESIAALQGNIKFLNDEKFGLQLDKKHHHQQLQAVTAENSHLQVICNSHIESLKQAIDTIAVLDTEKNGFQRALQQSQADSSSSLESMKSQLSEMEAKLQACQCQEKEQSLSSLHKQVVHLVAENSELRISSGQQARNLHEIKSILAGAEVKLRKEEKDAAEISVFIERLQVQVGELEAALNQRNQELLDCKQELDGSTTEAEALRKSIASLMQDKEKSRTESEYHRAQCIFLSSASQHQQKAYSESLRSLHEESDCMKSALQTEIDALKAAKPTEQVADNFEAEAASRLIELEKESRKLLEELQSAPEIIEQLADLNDTIAILEGERDRNAVEIEELNAVIDSLKEDIEQLNLCVEDDACEIRELKRSLKFSEDHEEQLRLLLSQHKFKILDLESTLKFLESKRNLLLISAPFTRLQAALSSGQLRRAGSDEVTVDDLSACLNNAAALIESINANIPRFGQMMDCITGAEPEARMQVSSAMFGVDSVQSILDRLPEACKTAASVSKMMESLCSAIQQSNQQQAALMERIESDKETIVAQSRMIQLSNETMEEQEIEIQAARDTIGTLMRLNHPSSCSSSADSVVSIRNLKVGEKGLFVRQFNGEFRALIEGQPSSAPFFLSSDTLNSLTEEQKQCNFILGEIVEIEENHSTNAASQNGHYLPAGTRYVDVAVMATAFFSGPLSQ